RLVRRERADRLMTVDAATAALAHEIRQPLVSIMTNAEVAMMVLAKVPPRVSEAIECASDVVAAVQRAESILHGVRDLFAKRPVERQLFDVRGLVEHVLALLRSDLGRRSISVRTYFNAEHLIINSSRFYLEQVLINLIKNSIQALAGRSSQLRSLSITVKAVGNEEVLIEVEDTGCGIEPDQQKRIFEPFVTTNSAEVNMGLGLPLCKSIMEKLNGDLTLQSSTPDGSVFVVRLPL